MKDESLKGAVGQRDGKMSDAPLDSGAGKVDHSRRRLAKAGMAAPVLVTLAGQPVFGGPVGGAGRCLSNMMSGNLSTQHIQSCALGEGPDFWKHPGGVILGADGWSNTGYVHSTSGSDCTDYAGGTLLEDTELKDLGPASSGYNALTLAEILCDGTLLTKNGDSLSNCVAALLSAKFSESGAVTGFNYILDVNHVVFYCFDPGLVLTELGFHSLDNLLEYTFS